MFLTGVLSTGGGLAFVGDLDRYFKAFDAETGKELWKTRLGAPLHGYPITYSVKGKQYIAVQSGWGVDAQRKQDFLDKAFGTKTNVPQGGVLWVFGLPETTR